MNAMFGRSWLVKVVLGIDINYWLVDLCIGPWACGPLYEVFLISCMADKGLFYTILSAVINICYDLANFWNDC